MLTAEGRAATPGTPATVETPKNNRTSICGNTNSNRMVANNFSGTLTKTYQLGEKVVKKTRKRVKVAHV
jgi:hypothetical protein